MESWWELKLEYSYTQSAHQRSKTGVEKSMAKIHIKVFYPQNLFKYSNKVLKCCYCNFKPLTMVFEFVIPNIPWICFPPMELQLNYCVCIVVLANVLWASICVCVWVICVSGAVFVGCIVITLGCADLDVFTEPARLSHSCEFEFVGHLLGVSSLCFFVQ